MAALFEMRVVFSGKCSLYMDFPSTWHDRLLIEGFPNLHTPNATRF